MGSTVNKIDQKVEFNEKRSDDRFHNIECKFDDIRRELEVLMDYKILQATGYSPQKKAQDTEIGKMKRKMYEIDIEKIFERIKCLKANETKELGVEIRKLERIVKEMKNNNYWSKDIKNKVSTFLNEMQGIWKKEPEFKELFKMENKRI